MPKASTFGAITAPQVIDSDFFPIITNAGDNKRLSVAEMRQVVGPGWTDTINASLYPGITDELKIQAAVDFAGPNSINRVFVPAAMLPYDANAITFNTAVQMVREGGDWGVYEVRAYGAAADGVENDTPASQGAIDAAKVNGGTIILSRTSFTYLMLGELDLTNAVGLVSAGFTLRGEGTVNTGVTGYKALITAKHNGHVFDCTGNLGIHFENITVMTDNAIYPSTCFFMARNTDLRSSVFRFDHCAVNGSFDQAVVYNYGCEDDQYVSCFLRNELDATDAEVMIFTGNNIRSLTSNFTTISTGAVSSIDHKIFGGEIHNQSHATNADCIYLEAVASVQIFGTWMGCGSSQAPGTDPRSIIYVDMTNSPTDHVHLYGITGESFSDAIQTYGIEFSNHARSPAFWTVDSCTFPNAGNTIHMPALPTPSVWYIRNVNNQSVGGGINFEGSLANSVIHDLSGNVSIGTSTNNQLSVPVSTLTVTNRDGDFWACPGSQSWTPSLVNVSVGGSPTVNNKTVHYFGRQIIATFVVFGQSSFVIAAGGLIPGLPVLRSLTGCRGVPGSGRTGDLDQ